MYKYKFIKVKLDSNWKGIKPTGLSRNYRGTGIKWMEVYTNIFTGYSSTRWGKLLWVDFRKEIILILCRENSGILLRSIAFRNEVMNRKNGEEPKWWGVVISHKMSGRRYPYLGFFHEKCSSYIKYHNENMIAMTTNYVTLNQLHSWTG